MSASQFSPSPLHSHPHPLALWPCCAGVAKHLCMFKMIQMPVEAGGPGAKLRKLTYCKFGTDYEKPTQIWTNIPSLIDELTDKDGKPHSHRCSKQSPCQHHGHHPNLGYEGGPTCNAAAFPEELVTFFKQFALKKADSRRNDDVPPSPPTSSPSSSNS